FSQGASTREFASAIESLGLQGVTYSVGYNNAWLDVAGAGVTKASGLEALRQILHVDEADTVAIGDGFTTWKCCSGPNAGSPWARRHAKLNKLPTKLPELCTMVG